MKVVRHRSVFQFVLLSESGASRLGLGLGNWRSFAFAMLWFNSIFVYLCAMYSISKSNAISLFVELETMIASRQLAIGEALPLLCYGSTAFSCIFVLCIQFLKEQFLCIAISLFVELDDHDIGVRVREGHNHHLFETECRHH